MVLGIGIDLCDVARMRRQLEGPMDDFVNSVFLPAEIAYCTGKRRPAEHFAARFAAKEATLKALAAAGGQGSFWHDIEIVNTGDGRPRLELGGRLSELAGKLGVRTFHVTMTHTADLASAVVLAET